MSPRRAPPAATPQAIRHSAKALQLCRTLPTLACAWHWWLRQGV